MKRAQSITKILALCLLALPFVRTPVQAEPLTLAECLEVAVAENPEMARARFEKQEAELRLEKARAGYYPELSLEALSGYKSRVNTTKQDDISVPVSPGAPPMVIPGPEFEIGDNRQHDLALSLRQPLYFGGQIKNGVRLFQAALAAARSRMDLEKRDIRHEVINAFYQLAMAEDFQKIALAAGKQIDSHLTDAENLLSQGMIIKSDLYPIKIRRLETDLKVVQAENAIARARAALATAMGLAPDSPVDIAVDWEQQPPWPIPKNITTGAVERAEQEIARQQIEMAAAEADIARAARLPGVGLTASTHYGWPGFTTNDPGWDTWWQAGVNITWNIFDMGRRRHEQMAAREKVNRLDKARQALDRRIDLDRINCRLAYEEACRQRIINKEKVVSARENYQTKADNFRVGMASGTDYLDAHTELMTAETDLSIAAARVRVAWADYLRSLGLDPEPPAGTRLREGETR